PNILILAFTIDPARDSVGRLKAYEGKLGVESGKWHLLTGNKDSIYAVAENFLVSAAEDPDAPGGHVHSGNFILVDKQHRLRGYYDGTKDESVTKLLEETDLLLSEKQP
ncbi:MAG TPA: SCO family protein, partial [Chitinophagales bacterium]|nr:SCO family protein [Chitinophagales bacterium]